MDTDHPMCRRYCLPMPCSTKATAAFPPESCDGFSIFFFTFSTHFRTLVTQKSLTNDLAGVRNQDKCGRLNFFDIVTQAYRLAAFHGRHDDGLAVMGKCALCLVNGGTEKGEKQKEKIQIPIWEKANLTIQEAAVYFNIGEKKLREMSNNPKCKFALFVGNKCLIKRKSLEEYLKHTSYI